MEDIRMAVGQSERKERRHKERRVFSYTAFFPDRRVWPDRRCRIPLHLVELEDEEIASLLESANDP
jgi:hypothetical protein